MLMLAFEARNTRGVAATLRRGSNAVDTETIKVLRMYGAALRNRVRKHAPRDTGGYASRIRWRSQGGAGDYYVVVSSPDVYSYRLEYGFVGVDSLGRNVNQAPRPHFRPAVSEIKPFFIASLRVAAKKAIENA